MRSESLGMQWSRPVNVPARPIASFPCSARFSSASSELRATSSSSRSCRGVVGSRRSRNGPAHQSLDRRSLADWTDRPKVLPSQRRVSEEVECFEEHREWSFRP